MIVSLLSGVDGSYVAFWLEVVDDVVYDIGFLQSSECELEALVGDQGQSYACLMELRAPSLLPMTLWRSVPVVKLALNFVPKRRRKCRENFECIFLLESHETFLGL